MYFEMPQMQHFSIKYKLDAVFLLKSVNTSTSIHKFLFTCKEWMAVGANLDAQVLFNRTCFKGIAASASYRCHVIFRLNCLFHDFHLLSALSLKRAQSYNDT